MAFAILPFLFFSQETDKYSSLYEGYFRGEEFYSNLQYGAAKKEFRDFITHCDNYNDPLFQKALYYEGMAGLELYNSDAIDLLMEYNRLYPENIHRKFINFKIGNSFFQDETYDDAQIWLDKLSASDLDTTYREEYHFKLGYAAFQNEDPEAAINAFRENLKGHSQYAPPSKYFFAHLCFERGSYQLALEQFIALEKNTSYCGIVPYYIVQIYHKQGDFDAVIDYAPTVLSCKLVNHEKDVNHIIGNAHYKKRNYQDALSYLIKYAKKSRLRREDAYQIGYAFFQTKSYGNAIQYLDQVARIDDSLGQISMYKIAECYQLTEQLLPARSAFEYASEMTSIPKIQEDALYNFAVISFAVDINPYDESVRAFENYLEKYPNSSRKGDVYQYLINAYSSTSNYKKAIESLKKLPNLDTRLKRVYQTLSYNHGVELFQKRLYNSSIRAFAAVNDHPIDPQLSALSRYWIADAYFRQNKMQEAIANYKMFIASPASNSIPEKIDAFYNIAYAYKEIDAETRASENFRIYLQSNPNNPRKEVDACFRVADIFYLNKENALAIEFYEKALAYNTKLNDKALYYVAKTYGYSGQGALKVSKLIEILTTYVDSKYAMNATYELANTYSSIGNNDDALIYYDNLLIDYPNSPFLTQAKIGKANCYLKKWQYEKAETAYLKVLAEHENENDVCEIAAKGLVDVYTALQKPQKAAEVVDRYSCINYTDDEKENLFYTPALQAYLDTNYMEAIDKFKIYLNNFSESGQYVAETYYYLGTSYLAVNDTLNGIENYKLFLARTTNSYSEAAARKVSRHYYSQKDYATAVSYYEKLELLATTPSTIFISRFGIMRSAYFMEDYLKSKQYAALVLESPALDNTQEAEANYALGISAYRLKIYTDAITPLRWLVGNTTTFMGSEAKYSLVYINFIEEDLEGARKGIKELLKMKPSYDYWIAKALILKSRIFVKEADYVQAEQNLKSVKEHYPIQDDGVVDEANALWQEILLLKEVEENKEEENPETKIEINEE
ncbi:MAG: tetratricopeptide repeat protein [Crocinitomicaceae bacterium]|tara:strand:- start:1477 stop:4521 length:3045 start_codon:yes stop_codon:yes gene_type:complete